VRFPLEVARASEARIVLHPQIRQTKCITVEQTPHSQPGVKMAQIFTGHDGLLPQRPLPRPKNELPRVRSDVAQPVRVTRGYIPLMVDG